VTDNANRTVADIRHVLSRNGGSLGASGSVAWQFERKGQILVDANKYDEETTLMAALEAGATDMDRDSDTYTVSTDVSSFHAVQEGLQKQGIQFQAAELAMVPKTTMHVDGADVPKLLKLLEAIEELEDVQKVYSNLDIDEAALAEAGA
jgi:YebC/PmpR family DNA-binding regulatory protein